MLLPPALNYLQPHVFTDLARVGSALDGGRTAAKRALRTSTPCSPSASPSTGTSRSSFQAIRPRHRHPLLRPHGPTPALRPVCRQRYPARLPRPGHRSQRVARCAASGATTAAFSRRTVHFRSACSIAARKRTMRPSTRSSPALRASGTCWSRPISRAPGIPRVLPDLLRHARRHRRPGRRVPRHRAAASGLRTSGRPAASALRPRACARQQLSAAGPPTACLTAGDDLRQQAPGLPRRSPRPAATCRSRLAVQPGRGRARAGVPGELIARCRSKGCDAVAPAAR